MAQLIIDVSEHNGAIDWQQVKDAGYHAIIRCGFGRFDQGGRYDYYWDRNTSECERLGIPYGVYWYSYASRAESAQVEARQCLDAISGRKISYPVYFDTEEPGTQSVSAINAEAFCSTVQNAGYRAGIYASESWWNSYLGGLADKYTPWVANWSRQPSIACDLWQRSGADGDNIETAPGVGAVDMNVVLNEGILNGHEEEPDTPVEGLPGPSVGDPKWNVIGIEGAVAEVALGEAVVVHPQIDTDTTGFTYNFTWNLLNGDWTNGNWGSTVLYTGIRTSESWYSFTPSKVGEYGIAIDCYDTQGGYRQVSFGFKCVEAPAETPKPEAPEKPTKPVLTYQQRAAEVFYHMCTHDGNSGHGYSQYQRWGDGTYESITLSDGTVVRIPNGDFDCSSGIITAWEAVLPGCTGGATYTGNMKSGFLSTGLWQWHPMGDGYIAQTGDVYLNIVHHTAMCWTAEPDILMQFSLSENGTITGQQGDQTGKESNVKPYYNYPWDGKLVYVGPQPSGSGGATVNPPTTADIDQLAQEVLEGKWGNGDERKAALGALYDAVQARVNELLAQSGETPEVIQIDIDGYWGEGTTKALQAYFGLAQDGVVAHQWPDNAQPAFTSGWQYDYTQIGADVVRSLQSVLGVTTDGILGYNTIVALQTRMGTYVDGRLDEGSTCVQEMQRRLNRGVL